MYSVKKVHTSECVPEDLVSFGICYPHYNHIFKVGMKWKFTSLFQLRIIGLSVNDSSMHTFLFFIDLIIFFIQIS